jgi:hypothetical protein
MVCLKAVMMVVGMAESLVVLMVA